MSVLLHTRRLLALVAATLVVALAGCGGAEEPERVDLIPQDTAATLESLLDDARTQFRQGECDELEATIEELDREGDQMPNAEVDEEVRTTLNAGIVRLGELADRCEPAVEEVAPVAPVEPVEPVEPAPAPVEPPPEEEPEEEPEEDQEESNQGQQDQQQNGSPGQSGNNPDGPGDPSQPPDEDPCANNSPRC